MSPSHNHLVATPLDIEAIELLLPQLPLDHRLRASDAQPDIVGIEPALLRLRSRIRMRGRNALRDIEA